MSNREVYIVTDDDEIYLGTIGKIIGAGGLGDPRLGQGISAAVVISDIVSDMAFNEGHIRRIFSIELREPRTT